MNLIHHGKLRITIIHRWVEMKVRRLIILELFLAWLTANPYPLKNKHLPRVAELLPKWHRGPQHEHHGHHAKPLQLEGHSHLKWVGRKTAHTPKETMSYGKWWLNSGIYLGHTIFRQTQILKSVYIYTWTTLCIIVWHNSSYMPKSYHP